MKEGMHGLRRLGRWLGAVMMVAVMFVWMQGPTVEANGSLVITDVRVEKDRLVEWGGYRYAYGETIDLILEFNQNVSCSGSFNMRFNFVTPESPLFQYKHMINSQTAVFSYKVENITVSGPLSFIYDPYSPTTIPCSASGTVYQVNSETNNVFSAMEDRIHIDIHPPHISRIATRESGNYGIGAYIELWDYFNENRIIQAGTVLHMNDGKIIEYGPYGFRYNVQEGDHVEQLDVVAIVGTITDYTGHVWDSSEYDREAHGLVKNNFYVYVDGIKPVIAATCDHCDEFTKNPREIITAIDNETGLVELSYEWSTSENRPASFSESIAVTGPQSEVSGEVLPPSSNPNGTYHLHVRAKDNANNVEYATFGPYYYDNAPPSVAVSPSNAVSRGGGSAVITATDAEGSGVDIIRYRWNEGPWQEHPGTSIEVLFPAVEGAHNLQVMAIDLVGNESAVQAFGPYTIDYTAPKPEFVYSEHDVPKPSHSVEVTVTGNRVQERGKLYYIWSSSSVKPDVNNSGWTVVFNNNFWILPMTRTIVSPEESGIWYLHVKTEDEIGNVEAFTLGEDVAGGVAFIQDDQPPQIDFLPDGNLGVYAHSETITLIVTDNVSDFEQMSIVYMLLEDGESPDDYTSEDWLATEDGIVEIAGMSGSIRVHVKATDEAGFTTYAVSEPFAVDHLPPQGAVNFSNGHGHTKETHIGLEFEAEDNLTSIELRYAFADGEWSEWLSYAQVKSEVIQYEDLVDGEGVYPIRVQYQDEASNRSEIYPINLTYDMTAPTVTGVTYEPMNYTNQPVNVTVTYADNFSPGSQVFQIEDNGTHTLTVFDLAGNSATVDVHIGHIDTIMPTIQFVVNGTTSKSQSVSTIVTAADNVSTPEQIDLLYAWSLSKDPLDPPQEWTAMNAGDELELGSVDGEWFLWVRAADEAGNERTSISNAFLLDNTSPDVADITFSPEYRTAMPVTAQLQFTEPVYLLAPYPTMDLVTRDDVTFDTNGTVEYVFRDEAGNLSSYTVVVDWIDNSLPSASVSMSTQSWTNEPVDVTISVEGEPPRALHQFSAPMDAELIYIKTIEGGILSQPEANMTVTEAVYRFHSNGTIHFVIEDLETGLSNGGQAQVNIIDVVPPTGEIRFTPTSWTQGNVTATLTTADNSGLAPEVFSDGGAEIVFTTNGQHTFQFRDAAGNVTELEAVVDWIVRATPEPAITFNTETWTNEPVTATISFPQETAPITITNHNSRTYVFENNGSFTFHYEDAAGNTGSYGPITVDWIDREKPVGTLAYSEQGWTNQDVIVTLNASDNSGAAVVFLNEGGNQHVFTSNGSFTFEFRDAAGNVAAMEAIVDRIDKTPLEASILYSTREPTNAVVRATVQPNKSGVQMVNNNGSLVYDFDHNGAFTFDMIDRAGNTHSATAEVDYIVRGTPHVEVVYSTTETTNGNVIATVQSIDPEQEIYVLNNYRREEYVFIDNGTFTFIVRDTAGNRVEVDAVVANIDKSTAAITLEYSETEPTRNDVTVTVHSDRELTVLNHDGSLEMTFTHNGIRWIHAVDAMGNDYWIEVVVDHIDRDPPKAHFTEGEALIIPVGTQVDLAQGLRIVDQLDGDMTSAVSIHHNIDPNRPGEYTILYEATDRAGNALRVERTARVVRIDQLSVFVNGEIPSDNTAAVVRGSDIHLQQWGGLGTVSVQWVRGVQLKGYFKTNGNGLDNHTLNVDQYGYYTFLIQDQQRQYQLVQVYVLPH